jgi:hypothetical protein
MISPMPVLQSPDGRSANRCSQGLDLPEGTNGLRQTARPRGLDGVRRWLVFAWSAKASASLRHQHGGMVAICGHGHNRRNHPPDCRCGAPVCPFCWPSPG